MADRLRTGIDLLDRKLDGGLPAGSLVALSAGPMSQGEMFLYELAKHRRTVYLTTIRSAGLVRRSMARADVPLEEVVVTAVGRPDPSHLSEDGTEAVLQEARAAIDGLDDGTTVIVDPVDVLERTDPTEYQAFVNELGAALAESDSVAFLHCLDGRDVPGQRDVTGHVVDVVLALTTEITDDRIETRLAVPKFRGRRALQETIKLNLESGIRADMSRNIA